VRKAAALAVGVAAAPGTQALKKEIRQIIKMVAERSFLFIIAIPVIYAFPLKTFPSLPIRVYLWQDSSLH